MTKSNANDERKRLDDEIAIGFVIIVRHSSFLNSLIPDP